MDPFKPRKAYNTSVRLLPVTWPSLRAYRTVLAALLLAVCGLAGCATSPTGRSQLRLFPSDQMAAMGLQAYRDVRAKTPVATDPALDSYVGCITNALARVVGPPQGGGQWQVTVFREDKTINAFALPGGHIGVYTGMLRVAADQGQLASVIGHEMGHVQAQHGNERVSNQFATQTGLQLVSLLAGGLGSPGSQQLMSLLGLGAQVGIILPFSRAQESEADALGLRYMASAGFDPHAAVRLWQRMMKEPGAKPPAFLSTHPSDQQRIANLEAQMAQVMPLYQQARAQGRQPDCHRSAAGAS